MGSLPVSSALSDVLDVDAITYLAAVENELSDAVKYSQFFGFVKDWWAGR